MYAAAIALLLWMVFICNSESTTMIFPVLAAAAKRMIHSLNYLNSLEPAKFLLR